jgi:hypothetical protein
VEQDKVKEVFATFGRFARRDLPYFFGGLSILFALQCATGIEITEPIPVHMQVLIYGASYILGSVSLEIVSLLGLVTTALKMDPCSGLLLLYRRWANRDWIARSAENADENHAIVYRRSAASIEHVDRANTMRHTSATAGSAWLISGFVLLLGWARTGDWRLVSASILVALLGLVLSILSHLHGMDYLEKLKKEADQPEKASTPAVTKHSQGDE